MEYLQEGMDIHSRLVENSFSLNVMVMSALLAMFTKYERIHKDENYLTRCIIHKYFMECNNGRITNSWL